MEALGKVTVSVRTPADNVVERAKDADAVFTNKVSWTEADALNNGAIAGTGINVLSAEPPAADNPLFTAENYLITPHIAWPTREASKRLMAMTVENLTAFLKGYPTNVVN
ncbi:NAD(P)-dependent oxidoreductase [Spirosoma spitsbergense]|uniref:NAD(P)-dependent oxidoreductase n=1 Tax=Spirosoma spitsbergense TaxID=431554 RepID=UPI00035EB23F|nr:NAD(P)-dependent oxidoreductase [Spirosoma spitsbergense]